MSKENHYSVFTDLDGTLLDHFDYNFDAALATIADLKVRHISIIPNTNKTFEANCS
jgi:mannosyl-3-phosphoglycerate phosphatase